MIEAGQYDRNHAAIISENFPIDQNGPDKVVAVLKHFGGYIKPEDAIKKMNDRGFRPGLIEELLAFGARYPEEEVGHPIGILGTVSETLGYGNMVCLRQGGWRRILSFREWDGNSLLLFVRKK